MGAPLNLVGMRFGRLVVTEPAGHRITQGGYTQRLWKCICDCGNTTVTSTQNLRSGDSKSCGCLKTDLNIKNATRHGASKTRLYQVWKAMRKRCNNANNIDYKYYGGKGISVCEEWEDFQNFADWAVEHGYCLGLTIDRIDTNSDYYPENCRWVDRKTQANNRTNNRYYTYGNELYTVSELAERYGIPYSRLYMRLQTGASITDALNLNSNNC